MGWDGDAPKRRIEARPVCASLPTNRTDSLICPFKTHFGFSSRRLFLDVVYSLNCC